MTYKEWDKQRREIWPDAYHYHLGVLPPDHPYKIQLRDFIKQDGRTRFNPEDKVSVVWIGGGDYDLRPYRF